MKKKKRITALKAGDGILIERKEKKGIYLRVIRKNKFLLFKGEDGSLEIEEIFFEGTLKTLKTFIQHLCGLNLEEIPFDNIPFNPENDGGPLSFKLV